MLKTGERVTVTVDRMAATEGNGVARHNNLVIFIPDSAPGDELLVEITKLKKNFAHAKVIELIKASQWRREAPCPVASDCGGCSWQHIKYEEQLRQKVHLLEWAMKPLTKLQTKLPKVEFQSSPNEFNYRNRIQVHLKSGKVGFLKKSSHEVVPITECLIAHENLNEQLLNLGETPGPSRIQLSVDKDIHFFSQVNSGVNKLLVDEVVASFSEDPVKKIFDLYGGAGNFARSLAELCPVTVVELDPKAVAAGKSNQISASFPVEFVANDVKKYLRELEVSHDTWACLLDPPRSGCDNAVIQRILELKPNKIVYVSCHPATMVRDLAVLLPSYTLDRIKGFDMFPQTPHLEAMCVLKLLP